MKSLRFYITNVLDPEDHNPDLPQIVVQPNGTAFADPAVIFTGPQWRQFTRRLTAATPADPDFDLPVTIKYLGLVFTARRTTDWMSGFNCETLCSQQSVFTVAFNFHAARRVLGFKSKAYGPLSAKTNRFAS